jgi:hypothetical protein
MSRKSVFSGLFGLAIIFFVLPFITVSCGGQPVMILSGVQLMTGVHTSSDIQQSDPQADEVGPFPLVTLAFLCAIVGLILGAFGQFLGAGIAGIFGFGFLILFRVKIVSQIVLQGGAPAMIRYDTGYWLALLLLLAVPACDIFYDVYEERRQIAATRTATPADIPHPLVGFHE